MRRISTSPRQRVLALGIAVGIGAGIGAAALLPASAGEGLAGYPTDAGATTTDDTTTAPASKGSDEPARDGWKGPGKPADAAPADAAPADPAPADPSDPAELTLDEVKAIAVRVAPGRVVEVDEDREPTGLRYDVTILHDNRTSTDVEVDATTGEVTSIDHDDDWD